MLDYSRKYAGCLTCNKYLILDKSIDSALLNLAWLRNI